MKQKTTGFFAEFRQFISRGNVMDLAIGVIIGAAFKAIIDSLTADILMPLIGILFKTDTFASLSVTVGSAKITYGSFLQAVLNFLLMALVLFLLVKAMNRFHRKAAAAPPAPPAPGREEVLLTEIRDLLKQK